MYEKNQNYKYLYKMMTKILENLMINLSHWKFITVIFKYYSK